jgi:hypothetical protein
VTNRNGRSAAARRIGAIGLKGSVALWCLGAPSLAYGQAAPGAAGSASAPQDEIVVTGIRQTMQTSIAVKRNENAIVDALDSKQIGDLPALSVGDAIESRQINIPICKPN